MILTAMKKDMFALTLNQRVLSHSMFEFSKNIGLLLFGYPNVSMIIRKVFEECNSYKCAFTHIVNSDVIATAYFIISGIEENEGAIISKDRFGIGHIEELNKERWFLIQTN